MKGVLSQRSLAQNALDYNPPFPEKLDPESAPKFRKSDFESTTPGQGERKANLQRTLPTKGGGEPSQRCRRRRGWCKTSPTAGSSTLCVLAGSGAIGGAGRDNPSETPTPEAKNDSADPSEGRPYRVDRRPNVMRSTRYACGHPMCAQMPGALILVLAPLFSKVCQCREHILAPNSPKSFSRSFWKTKASICCYCATPLWCGLRASDATTQLSDQIAPSMADTDRHLLAANSHDRPPTLTATQAFLSHPQPTNNNLDRRLKLRCGTDACRDRGNPHTIAGDHLETYMLHAHGNRPNWKYTQRPAEIEINSISMMKRNTRSNRV